jgi:hypothetical protein
MYIFSLINRYLTFLISVFTGTTLAQKAVTQTSGRTDGGKRQGPSPFKRKMQSEVKSRFSCSRQIAILSRK